MFYIIYQTFIWHAKKNTARNNSGGVGQLWSTGSNSTTLLKLSAFA